MQFTNVGMLNTVSKRLTSNVNPSAPPGVLNAEGGINGYYTNETTLGGGSMTDLMKQQRFDEQINNLLFGGSVDRRYMRMLNGDNTLDRQQKNLEVISNEPVNQKQLAVQHMSQQLPQQAIMGSVNDNVVQPSNQPVMPTPVATSPVEVPPAPERVKESQVTEGFMGFCNTHSGGVSMIICFVFVFVMFIMMQMYFTQKKMELMLEMYTGHGRDRYLYKDSQ